MKNMKKTTVILVGVCVPGFNRKKKKTKKKKKKKRNMKIYLSEIL